MASWNIDKRGARGPLDNSKKNKPLRSAFVKILKRLEQIEDVSDDKTIKEGLQAAINTDFGRVARAVKESVGDVVRLDDYICVERVREGDESVTLLLLLESRGPEAMPHASGPFGVAFILYRGHGAGRFTMIFAGSIGPTGTKLLEGK